MLYYKVHKLQILSSLADVYVPYYNDHFHVIFEQYEFLMLYDAVADRMAQ